MKRKKYVVLIVLIVSLIALVVFIVKDNQNESSNSQVTYSKEQTSQTDSATSESEKTISSNSYVSTALEEKKSLHNTYYFEKIYFDENKTISAGKKIIKYTNGEYFVAPYNCVITEMSLPESGEVCTNKHYIVIQSTDTLKTTMQIDEDEVSNVKIGQEAEIEITSLNKTIKGYVTKIANTATYSSSGSKFDVTIEFENDGSIMLGVSCKNSIVLKSNV